MDSYEQALLFLLDSAPEAGSDMTTDEVLLFLNDYIDWWIMVQETLDELYEVEEPESV